MGQERCDYSSWWVVKILSFTSILARGQIHLVYQYDEFVCKRAIDVLHNFTLRVRLVYQYPLHNNMSRSKTSEITTKVSSSSERESNMKGAWSVKSYVLKIQCPRTVLFHSK